jgi:hypothetical protein
MRFNDEVQAMSNQKYKFSRKGGEANNNQVSWEVENKLAIST